MKRVVAQLGLVAVSIVLGVILFVTGKEHRVFVENKSVDEYKAVKKVQYVVNDDKEIKVKKNKKKLSNVKGTTHEIVVTYEKAGENIQVEKSFKLKVMEEALISIPRLIGGSEDWIEYKRPEIKQKS